MTKGWTGESTRHRMSAYGIKSGTKNPLAKKFRKQEWIKLDANIFNKLPLVSQKKKLKVGDTISFQKDGLSEKVGRASANFITAGLSKRVIEASKTPFIVVSHKGDFVKVESRFSDRQMVAKVSDIKKVERIV